MKDQFVKVVKIGSKRTPGGRWYYVYCKIILYKKEDKIMLSISGVEGPLSSGNALGSTGQINPVQVERYAEGWNEDMLRRFNEIWSEYHLNDMHLGTIVQERILEQFNCTSLGDPRVKQILKEFNVLEHCGSVYGTEFKTRKISEEIIRFLYNLPTANKMPAWV